MHYIIKYDSFLYFIVTLHGDVLITVLFSRVTDKKWCLHLLKNLCR